MFPDLSSVITQSDVSKKGTGSYSAEYINWAKVSHLLQTHAKGWQFHLRTAPEGLHVWKAPNNTGYVVGYFTSPEGVESADFPQAVMDNRNQPVLFEKISARDVTDTHRRALCAAACFTFGLAYQLWAKEKIEDPLQRDEPAAPHETEPIPTTPPPAKERDCARLFTISGSRFPKEKLDTLKPLLGVDSWKTSLDWQFNLGCALTELAIAHGWETMLSLTSEFIKKAGTLEKLTPAMVKNKITILDQEANADLMHQQITVGIN